MARVWSEMILTITEDRGDEMAVAGVDSDMATSSVENYSSMQRSVTGKQGMRTESRELAAGCGQGLGINSPRASGEVGAICVAIQQLIPQHIGWLGPVVVESDKRALNVTAEGIKRLLCGDNSGGRRRKHRAGDRATLANCRHVGWAGRH
jgi:hypothetical protein